jgi:N-acetyl-anhydromuramyl-L-alanine amidase AmpD
MHKDFSLNIVKDSADNTNFSSRINAVILHYTNLPETQSLEILKHSGVSVHFLVPKGQKNSLDLKVIQMVDMSKSAWHAGASYWQSRYNLNDISIGIEIINYGFGFAQEDGSVLYYHHFDQMLRDALRKKLEEEFTASWLKEEKLWHIFLTDMLYGRIPAQKQQKYYDAVSPQVREKYKGITRTLRSSLPDPFKDIQSNMLYNLAQQGKIVWDEFPLSQIQLLSELLRHILSIEPGISPTSIIGHSDISPGRKQDPGPKFPWKYLAELGIGAWPDEAAVRELQTAFNYKLPEIGWIQTHLLQYGYNVETTHTLDQQTKEALMSFQMHFRPHNYSGLPDAETCAILGALIKKYFPETK